jgi:hypothetical protein
MSREEREVGEEKTFLRFSSRPSRDNPKFLST